MLRAPGRCIRQVFNSCLMVARSSCYTASPVESSVADIITVAKKAIEPRVHLMTAFGFLLGLTLPYLPRTGHVSAARDTVTLFLRTHHTTTASSCSPFSERAYPFSHPR